MNYKTAARTYKGAENRAQELKTYLIKHIGGDWSYSVYVDPFSGGGCTYKCDLGDYISVRPNEGLLVAAPGTYRCIVNKQLYDVFNTDPKESVKESVKLYTQKVEELMAKLSKIQIDLGWDKKLIP